MMSGGRKPRSEELPEAEHIELYRRLGPAEMSRVTGISITAIQSRRKRIEQRTGHAIVGPNGHPDNKIEPPQGHADICIGMADGVIIVASDAHYWPGEITVMHRALVHYCKMLRPKVVVLNGDVMDLPRASRHATIGWEKRPEIADEIEWSQERLHEIALACGRGTRKIWTIGNHDQRFETRIANLAPEYAKIHGVHLKDHFPLWEPAWSTSINPGTFDTIFIKHRFKGGKHAVYNNVMHTGEHSVTGHLHSAQVRAVTFNRGRTLWGMDTGCVADVSARAFTAYTENGPKDWRSAFGILTVKNGQLLQPELVLKWDNEQVQFRGEIVKP